MLCTPWQCPPRYFLWLYFYCCFLSNSSVTSSGIHLSLQVVSCFLLSPFVLSIFILKNFSSCTSCPHLKFKLFLILLLAALNADCVVIFFEIFPHLILLSSPSHFVIPFLTDYFVDISLFPIKCCKSVFQFTHSRVRRNLSGSGNCQQMEYIIPIWKKTYFWILW